VTLVPTLVSNTTKNSYDVLVSPVLLTQNLTGAFEFAETPVPLSNARKILSAQPSRFRLAPGQSHKVGLRWNLLALGGRTAYVGVIFQGQARLKSGASVPVITRLLSTNFLRLPGTYRLHGKFTALHTIQFAPKVLRILPRVMNTGNRIDAPTSGRLSIRDSTGRTRFHTGWKGDVILPRAEREFPIDIRQILPAGTYTAKAVMSFGSDRYVRTSANFTLVGPNQLPTPALKITEFAAHGEVGQSARISGRIESTGTSPATLDLHVKLFRVTRGSPATKPLASRRLRVSTLPPRTTRTLDLELPTRLTAGSYHVLGDYVDATGAPQQLTSDFAASQKRGLVDRIRAFFDTHSMLIVLGIALIVIAFAGLRLVRRQRRLEAELRRVKAEHAQGVPPAP
jgi:hypothetical protein